MGLLKQREKMIKIILLQLFFRLIKNYHIFFVVKDKAYYVNDICIDCEMKEIILQYLERGGIK